MNVSLEDAATRAKTFLFRQGIWVVSLEGVEPRADRWVVKYQQPPAFGNQAYEVEVLKVNGDIAAFRKSAEKEAK